MDSIRANKYLNKPVYVPTSSVTGSGAERFAYDMQVFGRGIIVGEATIGGAHTDTYQNVDADFRVLPTGRAEKPVTGTIWERVGVKPDIAARHRCHRRLGRLHAQSSGAAAARADHLTRRRRNLERHFDSDRWDTISQVIFG